MIIKTSQLVEQLDAYCRYMRIPKKDFYAELGLSSAAVSLWRTGKNDPTRKALARIEECVGMPMEQFLTTDFGASELTPPTVTEKTLSIAGSLASPGCSSVT